MTKNDEYPNGPRDRGRLLLAIEKYKNGEASLSRSAKLAGLPAGQMMTILVQFGVENRIEANDYLQSLQNLRDIL